GLAVVDFGNRRSELALLTRQWGLPRIEPDRAAAHLAGHAVAQGHGVEARDLLRWEAACVMAPRSITEDDAQRLRRVLGLRATAFEIEALRERGGRGRARLEWSATARAEVLARFERGHGYLDGWS